MYSDILSFVKTTEDRDTLLGEIEALEAVKFEPRDNIEAVLAGKVRKSVGELLREKAREPGLDAYLEGLRKAIESLAEIKLTLAKEPSSESLDAIMSWLAKNVSENSILSLSVTPAILGGAIVASKGKYYDGSLAQELNLIFASERENIIKTIYSSETKV